MSDFTELIKNFERIRDYMRQFFVYGFKVRINIHKKVQELMTMRDEE